MKAITIKKEFRVVPSAWENINDSDIVRMFDAYCDFYIMNEESMSLSEGEKAMTILSDWAKHLNKRNLLEKTRCGNDGFVQDALTSTREDIKDLFNSVKEVYERYEFAYR